MAKKIKILLFGIFALAFCFCSTTIASILDWNYLENDKFIVFYPKGYEQQAKDTFYYLNKHQPDIKKLTGNDDNFKVRAIVQDLGSFTNAYADPVNNKISVFTNPSSFLMEQNWFRAATIHENIHINQLTNSTGAGKMFTFIFGNYFSPNLWVPSWIVEGITVYGESQTSKYEGRLNDGYLNAIVAAKAKANNLPSALQANYTYAQYPMGAYYTYGGSFFEYLSLTYGEDKFADFFRLNGSYFWELPLGIFLPACGADLAAKQVFGKGFPALFKDWADYRKTEAASWEIKGACINKEEGLMSCSNLASYDKNLFYFKDIRLVCNAYTYYSAYSLVEYDPKTRTEKTLEDFNYSPLSYCKKIGQTIYYALPEIKDGYANVNYFEKGIVAILYAHDIKTGKSEEIFSDELLDFAVLDTNKIVYTKIRKDAFGSEIWSYNKEGGRKKLGNVGEFICQIVPYQDGLLIAGRKHLSSFNISYLNLKDFSLIPIINTPWHEYKIKLAQNHLYFTGCYDKRVSTYKYDFSSRKVWKLTNSSYADDGLVLGDKLYFIGTSQEGQPIFEDQLSPVEFKLSREMIPDEAYSSPDAQNDSLSRNWGYLFQPSSRFFPFLAGGEDALGYNAYQISYASSGGLNFNFSSAIFNPLIINYSYLSLTNEATNQIELSYPAYFSMKKGLSSVILDLTTDFKEVIPGVSGSFSFPRLKIKTHLQTDFSDGGVNADLGYVNYLENASINLAGSLYKNFTRIRKMRGLSQAKISHVNGYQFSLDYTHKLFEIRNGLWNPNFFLGDVFGTSFVEGSKIDKSYSGFGCELAFESGLGLKLMFVPTFGFSIINGELQTYYDLGLSF